MLRVIVNIKRKDEERSYDLELPAEIPIIELIPTVAEALNWSDTSSEEVLSYYVYASPPGRHIHSNESLVDIGAWDGTYLIFEPTSQGETLSITKQHMLVFLSDAGTRYAVRHASCILGRQTATTSKADRLIDLGQEGPGQSVSRHHAQLDFVNNQWQLSVLHGEKNRTVVNGDRIASGDSCKISDGDILILGKLNLIVAEAPGNPRDAQIITDQVTDVDELFTK